MNPESLLALITDNPLTASAIAFFGPVMLAIRAAMIRKIEAWADEDADADRDDHVRDTAARMLATTRFPLPQGFVERHIRSYKSGSPPPL